MPTPKQSAFAKGVLHLKNQNPPCNQRVALSRLPSLLPEP